MTALPPTYYLHVWFSRRPWVASRAAILGGLLEADADRNKFLHDLGIHGDPVASKVTIAEATAKGERLGAAAYGYARAFEHLPPPMQPVRTVLDPTAGGGSIPFEAARLGCDVVGNDLNPVASLVLKATVELPLQYGAPLLERVKTLSAEFLKRVRGQIVGLYPTEPNGWTCDGYLWARTVTCPYCGGLVPLSPNWKLSGSGHGVRLVPENGRVRFEIVQREIHHAPGTVKGGNGSYPFPEYRQKNNEDKNKHQKHARRMGQKIYYAI
jgi:adenine-specific DNA methylase